jgi:endonuclease/exonuclease/phosphatase family metal-dependent hydrolase
MLSQKRVDFLSFVLAAATLCSTAHGQTPVVVETNTVLRVMASNLSSGNYQRYEGPGLRILQGLRPDVVAIQEFNYASTNGLGVNTSAAIREMIDATFGADFSYFRESGYNIPNGIISRYPIVSSGSWDDVTSINDRGFAWAQIRLPGTNDLYVVSVHLKASSGYETQRATEATNVTALIQSIFPSGAWVIVAGDFNTHSPSEACLAKFKSYLSDSPIPNDGGIPTANSNTSEPRSQRYDYVLPSFSLASNLTPVVLASTTNSNGLVFDSRVYKPLTDVSPVLYDDSHVVNMQHMGVAKDFKISWAVTNYVYGLPSITAHPKGQTVVENHDATFAVEAQSASPVGYQWCFRTAPIAGATSSSYTRTNVCSVDAGAYFVIVTNDVGPMVSSNAMLTVLVRPSIVTPPAPLVVGQGADALFAVEASGSEPLSYQWHFNSSPIAGATESAYTRTNVQPPDVGNYSVTVTNITGSPATTGVDLNLNIPQPSIRIPEPGLLTWYGLSNFQYSVQMKWSLEQTNWENFGTAASSENLIWFTNTVISTQQFFRVTYP